jgi:hypothetical protein
MPAAIRTTLSRKGTLQPQAKNWGLGSEEKAAKTMVESIQPAGVPICGQLERSCAFLQGHVVRWKSIRLSAPLQLPVQSLHDGWR